MFEDIEDIDYLSIDEFEVYNDFLLENGVEVIKIQENTEEEISKYFEHQKEYKNYFKKREIFKYFSAYRICSGCSDGTGTGRGIGYEDGYSVIYKNGCGNTEPKTVKIAANVVIQKSIPYIELPVVI